MKVAVLFSGGKDSVMSLKVALDQGWDVKYLVTISSENKSSWMFHSPCIELTKLQAESVGISHLVKTTAGEKEKEIGDLVEVLKSISSEVDGIVSGAVASRYQKDRIDSVCKELGLKSLCPLWGKDQMQVLRQQLEAGLEIVMVAVAADGFNRDWLGRKFDNAMLGELDALKNNKGINPVGEGGEYESFVVNAPMFRKRIDLGKIEKIWDPSTGSGYITCREPKLV